MTLQDLASLPLPSLAAQAGLTTPGHRSGGLGCSPCPACKSDRVSRTDRRPPVLLRSEPQTLSGAWCCSACHRSGTRADLLALAILGRGWSECSREEQAQVLGRPAPAVQPVATPAPKARYLTPEEWRLLSERSWEARLDPGCCAWAERRGLRLTPDLRALPKEPDPDLPLWSAPTERYPEPRWLPGAGYRLLLPTTDASGEVRGARLRNTMAAPRPKELGLPGFSAVGLLYASSSLRARWARGERADRPCIVVEGKPDQLAAWQAWGRTHEVLGIMSGSLPGRRWPELLHESVTMVVQLDPVNERTGRRQAEEYWKALVKRIPRAQRVDMAQVYAAAGLPHAERLDLASREIVGRWPGWMW